jgi:hypothetical protein
VGEALANELGGDQFGGGLDQATASIVRIDLGGMVLVHLQAC